MDKEQKWFWKARFRLKSGRLIYRDSVAGFSSPETAVRDLAIQAKQGVFDRPDDPATLIHVELSLYPV